MVGWIIAMERRWSAAEYPKVQPRNWRITVIISAVFQTSEFGKARSQDEVAADRSSIARRNIGPHCCDRRTAAAETSRLSHHRTAAAGGSCLEPYFWPAELAARHPWLSGAAAAGRSPRLARDGQTRTDT